MFISSLLALVGTGCTYFNILRPRVRCVKIILIQHIVRFGKNKSYTDNYRQIRTIQSFFVLLSSVPSTMNKARIHFSSIKNVYRRIRTFDIRLMIFDKEYKMYPIHIVKQRQKFMSYEKSQLQ